MTDQSIASLRERESASVSGRIREVRQAKKITTKDGTSHTIQECLLEDGSGSIVYNLWDAEVDTLNVGDSIRLEKGWVTSFSKDTENPLRLQTGKYGKLTRL